MFSMGFKVSWKFSISLVKSGNVSILSGMVCGIAENTEQGSSPGGVLGAGALESVASMMSKRCEMCCNASRISACWLWAAACRLSLLIGHDDGRISKAWVLVVADVMALRAVLR